jgi:hypothetical protein
MPFPPQPPARRLTHRGKDISTLQKPSEITREIVQEVVEAIVFLSLAWAMAADTAAGEPSAVALLTGIVLMSFCADRLAVVCELIVRFNTIGTDEE